MSTLALGKISSVFGHFRTYFETQLGKKRLLHPLGIQIDFMQAYILKTLQSNTNFYILGHCKTHS